MLTIFKAAASATSLQDIVDERASKDVVDLAEHRRQRSERNQPRAAVIADGAAVEGR
jgi:hypothetical protein